MKLLLFAAVLTASATGVQYAITTWGPKGLDPKLAILIAFVATCLSLYITTMVGMHI